MRSESHTKILHKRRIKPSIIIFLHSRWNKKIGSVFIRVRLKSNANFVDTPASTILLTSAKWSSISYPPFLQAILALGFTQSFKQPISPDNSSRTISYKSLHLQILHLMQDGAEIDSFACNFVKSSSASYQQVRIQAQYGTYFKYLGAVLGSLAFIIFASIASFIILDTLDMSLSSNPNLCLKLEFVI